MLSQSFRILSLAMVLGSLAGCGGADDGKATQSESQAIAGLVADTAEKCSAPQPAKELFVTVPDRATLKKYASYTYAAEGTPTIKSDTATVSVTIFGPDGQELTKKDWTLTKVGDQWKLQDAPLP